MPRTFGWACALAICLPLGMHRGLDAAEPVATTTYQGRTFGQWATLLRADRNDLPLRDRVDQEAAAAAPTLCRWNSSGEFPEGESASKVQFYRIGPIAS